MGREYYEAVVSSMPLGTETTSVFSPIIASLPYVLVFFSAVRHTGS